jgi:hypothetical protein
MDSWRPKNTEGVAAMKLLTLKPGQELTDLVFRMRPGAVITGKIMDAEGDPILKASVQVFRQHSGSPR